MFDRPLSEADPDIAKLSEFESARQRDKLLMIPSESLCPRPVLEALATPFSNKYAEGYASTRMTRRERDRLPDFDRYLSFHRRYGDRRFYKGTEFANFVEALAQKRCAEAFGRPDAFVNVQSHSGAPANNSIYDAFLEPGDSIMGMHLSYGGHLTHGSPFNRSGKYYKVAAYVTGEDGRIDVDAMRAEAREHRPKMVIAGASAYPWTIDWAPLRGICDEVGAKLVADISHPAGLVSAGLFPNPVGVAHVTMFTTHKTMLGPRGAVILSTERPIAKAIDTAVFPGEQGGPHVNSMAAKAVCFKLALTDEFRGIQKRIVDNMAAFVEEFRALGLPLAFGGSDTHLCLIDLREMDWKTGVSLTADIATNILDLCGIVCNKNALPGDETGVRPSGIRFGSVILSQRGFGTRHMKTVAQMVHRVLTGIHPFRIRAGIGKIVRGKLDFGLMQEVRQEVRKLTGARPAKSEAFEVAGERATVFLEHAGSADLYTLEVGQARRCAFFGADGKKIEEAEVQRLDRDRYHVNGSADLRDWLTALSDGYVRVEESDVYAKVHGPVAISPAAPTEARATEPAKAEPSKVFYVGQRSLARKAIPADRTEYVYKPEEAKKLRRTPLTKAHKALGAKMLPFAGYTMPGWYGPVAKEHETVRTGAGLFDVSHMGTLDVSGALCAEFLDCLTTNYIVRLDPGQSQYNYVLGPDGRVMDDVIVYRMTRDRFLLVVNAVNQDKIWRWMTGINERRFLIDKDAPEKAPPGPVEIRRLKDTKAGGDRLIDLAFEGPKSMEVLGRQNVGYELLVHPDGAEKLWTLLLETGKDLGAGPAGLGARDSTRTEAGFPLYGHELAGDYDIIPSEAGYGAFVKRHKPFFIGKAPLVAREETQTKAVVRFRMKKTGIKAIRPGDPVVVEGGIVGNVTSTVMVDKTQIGMAYVPRTLRPEGTELKIALLPRRGEAKYDASLAHEPAEVLPRFQLFD
ncbi:MAG: serine hydroxymethyltransferase [Planctomycetota bacterium]